MSDTEKKQDSTVSQEELGSAVVPEWSDRQEWELNLRVQVRKEYEALMEGWKAEALEEVRKEYDGKLKEGLAKFIEEWKAEQKPPTHEEVQQLLDQEYETFTLNVTPYSTSSEVEPKMFTLRELPQEAEEKFYKQLKERLLKNVPALQTIAQETMDMPFEERAKAYFSAFDEGFNILADAVVIILNPFGDDKDITRQWVKKNISSNRQWQIIEAQLKVNRVKDFFSKLFQSGQSTQMMMTGPSIQTLLPQVR